MGMGIGDWGLGIGDWGLGIGDWGLGPIPNRQSPIPNSQSPIPKVVNEKKKLLNNYKCIKTKFLITIKIKNYLNENDLNIFIIIVIGYIIINYKMKENNILTPEIKK